MPLSGEWSVLSIRGVPVVEDSGVMLAFSEDGSLHGNSGVNALNGTWTNTAHSLTFGPLAMTRRMGPPPLNEQEQRFTAALDEVANVSQEANGQLVLSSSAGDELVRMTTHVASADGSVSGTLSGTVTYRERIALVPGHELTVQLLDVSLADAPSITLAETSRTVTTQVPLAFTLDYEASDVESRHRYVLRATLHDPAGNLAWTTDTAHPVLEDGQPTSGHEIVLKRVGR